MQIYRLSPEGKKLVIATLGAGTFFGEIEMRRMHFNILNAGRLREIAQGWYFMTVVPTSGISSVTDHQQPLP